MDSNAWLVPMTIGLCLDMCGIFLLTRDFTNSSQLEALRKTDPNYIKLKKSFENANKNYNLTIKLGRDITFPLIMNELARIEHNLAVNQSLFFANLKLKDQDKISNLIILLFGISLMILGIALNSA